MKFLRGVAIWSIVVALSAGVLATAQAQQAQITVLVIADKTWLPDVSRQFEAKTGIRVNVVLSDYGEMLAKLAAAVSAKTHAYDVVWANSPEWRAAGYLEPLDARINSLPDKNDLLGRDIGQYRGQTYGMPWLIDNRVFIYNAKMLKDAGFDKPPSTWSELIKVGEALKGKGLRYPIILPWAQHEGEFDEFATTLGTFGGRLFDSTYTKPLFNSQEGVAALRMMTDLHLKYDLVNPDSLASKSFQVSTVLSQGNAAFGTTWTLLRGMFNDPNKSKVVGQLRAMLYPGVRPGMTATYEGSETLGIPVDSANKATAWQYIVWVTGKDVERQVFVKERILPIWKSLYLDKDLVKADPDLPVILSQRKNVIPHPPVTWLNEYSQVMQAAVLEALTGKKSPKQALDEAAAETAKLIK